MRFAILGSGAMGVKCLQRLQREPGANPVLVLVDPAPVTGGATLYDTAHALAVPALHCPRVRDASIVQALKDARIDWLFSIHNHQILPQEILALAAYGSINLHDAPLPRYAGRHACSWAILNGESSHGVTWHKMDEGIDSGPILAQATFPLDAQSTAATIMLQVMREGLALFDTLLPKLVSGKVSFTLQQGERSYYTAKEKPFGGKFPFTEPYETLERLSRAIDFHPLPNNFYRPIITVGEQAREVESFRMERVAPNASAGTVLEAMPQGIKVATSDAIAQLEMDANGLAVGSKLGQ